MIFPQSFENFNKRKPIASIDLRKKKQENKNEQTKKQLVKKKECPLRNVCPKTLLGMTSITIPILLGGLYIYNNMTSEKKELTVAEKTLGEFLYKLEPSEIMKDDRSQSIQGPIDNNEQATIFNRMNATLNNIKSVYHFFTNAKKMKTDEVVKDYTILFFHSYNVDVFLKSKNIKTYVERFKEVYEKINKKNNVNVIYVPLDNKMIHNVQHAANMNWYSVLFNDRKQILKLIKKYNIMNIPTMVLLDKNMNVIQDNINYLLLYKSDDFPFTNINNLTYIDYLQDKNNNKYLMKKLKSDYFFFYFNNDKDNKEDIEVLLKIKKKLAEKNIQFDIVFVKGVSKHMDTKKEPVKEHTGETKIDKTNEKKNRLEGIKRHDNTEDAMKSYKGNGETSENSEKIEKTKPATEEQLENVYSLGDMENNVIYKLLLYDTFDITYKPSGVLIDKTGRVLNKYVNISKREDEINTFIYGNHKSSYEPINVDNYIFKFENISNLNNLNVFAPIFILFSDKLDLDMLKQYNSLIEIYKKNRKGKKIYFYFLPSDNKKYDMLKKLCSANQPNEMIILDLFSQQVFKDSANNLGVVQKVKEEPKYILSKENFLSFINRYYDNELSFSRIHMIKQT